MAVKLTKRIVDGAQPGEKDSFLFDSDVIGFGLKITPAGRKVYLVQYRIQGTKKRLFIGVHGSPWTPDQARLEAIRLLGLVAQGVDPAQEKQDLKNAETMVQLCDMYFAEGVMTLKPRTIEVDRGRAEHHIKPLLGHIRVKDVTAGDVERFMQAVAEGQTKCLKITKPRGRSVVTGGKGVANRCMALLSGMFTFAMRRNMRSDNPVRGIKRFPEHKLGGRLTAEELGRIGDAIRELQEEGVNPNALAAIRFIGLTGMRVSEALGLTWQAVDFETGVVHLSDSKTGQQNLQIGAPALALLASLPRVANNDYCFPGALRGQPLTGITRPWYAVRERAGLHRLRLHDLRHGFVSQGVVGGLGLYTMGSLVGHKSQLTTQRYAHMGNDPLRIAANRVSTEIAAAMDGASNADVVTLPADRKVKAV
ncbi:MAG: tyrosine-type recombinase/integrase [Magnetococcales bacterium]|nr:tyrosine-type recombinase/integrase [Magnetococcales bacterium]